MVTHAEPPSTAFGPVCDQLDDRCLLSGYSPAHERLHACPDHQCLRIECDHVHVLDRLDGKGDGTGETIALIEMYSDPNLQSDLDTFDAKYGLPNPTLTVVNQAGSQTDSGWARRSNRLDVEWAHAIAPGANILVVEAAPSSSADAGVAEPVERGEHGAEHGRASWRSR